jgi:hypothetical protein
MGKSNFKEIIDLFEGMEARAKLIDPTKSLEEIVASLGIDASIPSEAIPLFDTPEGAKAYVDDPTAKNVVDAIAKFIVDGSTNG